MPKLTFSAIAKLYGMHRTTLYAAVKAKRVSIDHNLKGQKVIDLAEAIRVWGEPEHHPERPIDTSTGGSTLNSTPAVDLAEIIAQAVAKAVAEAVEPLRLEIQQLRQENAEQRLICHDKAPETKVDVSLADDCADLIGRLKARH
ncbi:hypothetical protein JFT37_27305 [Pseudomonas fluorescens]|nr:hypothetical protein [Pseudomonas fluorescens]